MSILLLHVALLRLPYFWDEAGYYIPAARDLLLTHTLIPHSTPSNAHPPLVMAWLALWWSVFGCSLLTTRMGMLAVAAFALLGVYRLARLVANPEVALGATICTALYPVFFTQSAMAHVDLAAAGFTFWGLYAYVRQQPLALAVWFALASLAKETAVLAPLALLIWEIARRTLPVRAHQIAPPEPATIKTYATLLFPILPLGIWYLYHLSKTGYLFGNPEFFRYNVQTTLSPLRFPLALGMRVWQTFGYMHLYFLTAATLLALFIAPQKVAPSTGVPGMARARIAIETQIAFAAVIAIYVIALALVGGAVLARYMLPVVPLVIILGISTLWRRLAAWRFVTAAIALLFVAGLFINPPYGFSFEDNLAYRDYILLHQHAEAFLETHLPSARVLSAWPATDELSQPFLGYVSNPMSVVGIEDFTMEHIQAATQSRASFDAALVFSTKYQPRRTLLDGWEWWDSVKARFFGFHRDLPPDEIAHILGGRVIYQQVHHGQWIAVIQKGGNQ